MKQRNSDIEALLALLRAGLWEKEVRLSTSEGVDFDEIYRLAEYQSVTGLVAAGLEHLRDVKAPQRVVLQFVSTTLQLENRNRGMNDYLKELIHKLGTAEISALLLKGQGIAQCYERPLWRVCGDIDLFLSDENYKKAKQILTPLAASIEPEEVYKKHLGLMIDGWLVELHGNLYSSLSLRIERTLDAIYTDTFYKGEVRSWNNGGVQVFQMSKENDVIYVFTHILQHYFHGGIGLRQICDWSRMLWCFRTKMDLRAIESRIKRMRLMTEWRAFAYFAVNELGMQKDTMPFYENSPKWKRKADQIKYYIFKTGNFGNRDLNYVRESSYLSRKLQSFRNTISETLLHFRTFPMDSIRFFIYYSCIRLQALFRGE